MDRRRKDHAVAPLKSKSGEQNASHQWASVRKESISYPLVGGRRGKTNLCWWGCVKMTHWAWHTHTPSYRSAFIASSLSCPPSSIPSLYLLTSFCRWWSHATTPGSPPVLPTLARLLLPKAINPWNQGAEAARGIIHKKWAQFNTRGQRWLAAFPSMAWKAGQRRWPSINFPARFTFFPLEILGQWDSAIEGVLNPW